MCVCVYSNVDGDEASVRQEESRLRSKRMLDKDPDQDTFLCQAPGRKTLQTHNEKHPSTLRKIHNTLDPPCTHVGFV